MMKFAAMNLETEGQLKKKIAAVMKHERCRSDNCGGDSEEKHC